MAKYEIREHGQTFATIEAESAEAALAQAEQDFPRRRSDYDMAADDEPFTVQWWAFALDRDEGTAMLEVSVPSR